MDDLERRVRSVIYAHCFEGERKISVDAMARTTIPMVQAAERKRCLAVLQAEIDHPANAGFAGGKIREGLRAGAAAIRAIGAP